MVRDEIKNLIKKIVKQEVHLEHPSDVKFGDYSTNVAMTAKIAPQKIASQLKDKPMFEKIEIAGPGFINLYLSKEFLAKQIGKIEIPNIGQAKKIQVEFISANPTGPLHIGHGRGAFFGDTLVNVLEKVGFEVEREYYINDAENSKQIQQLGKTALGKGTTYLTEKLKTQISKVKSTTKNLKLSESEAGYFLAQAIQKDNQNFITKILKIKFDNWFSEKSLYEENKIEKTKKELKDLTYEKEGALWLKTAKFNDEKDRVLVRKNNQPTYFLSDIAYHQDKFSRGFDRVIDIWGADHHGYIDRMQAAMKMLGRQDKLTILISQIVRLKGGKLSKRKGQVIDLEWLVDEVGLDATRFFYLMKSLDTQMEFDVELAREKSEKNPVYYVQYAHARICSILAKFKADDVILRTRGKSAGTKNPSNRRGSFADAQDDGLNHPAELNLIRQLIKYPEIVEDIVRTYQVQKLPHYAIDLAKTFHYFYKYCRVIGGSKQRLKLVKQTKRTLKECLGLMGISSPEKM